MADEEPRPLRARDSARRWFLGLCVVCWLAWLAVALLTAWALHLANAGTTPLTRGDVLASFWAVTWGCVAVPATARGLIWWFGRS